MDKVTTDRLEKLAPLIQKFLELHPDEQEWLLPLLGKAERRAITILQEIDNCPLTYNEAGKLTSTHPNTVKQTLYALSNGGMNFGCVAKTGQALVQIAFILTDSASDHSIHEPQTPLQMASLPI